MMAAMSDQTTALERRIAERTARVTWSPKPSTSAVNDIRETTAFEILEMLARKGARVAYADPLVPQLALESLKLDRSSRPPQR